VNSLSEKKRTHPLPALPAKPEVLPPIPEASVANQIRPPNPAPYVPVEQAEAELQDALPEAELQDALPEIPVETPETQEQAESELEPAPIQKSVLERKSGFKAKSRNNFRNKLRENKQEQEQTLEELQTQTQPALQKLPLQTQTLQTQTPLEPATRKQIKSNTLKANINRRLQGAIESKKRGNEAYREKQAQEQARKAQQAPLSQQKSKFCYI
jgi:hypothetical protein